MKYLPVMALLLLSTVSHADINNCMGVYVGMIQVEKGGGLTGVTFHDSPTDASGSYYQNFSGWSADDKKAVLAILTAAKVSQHRVNVTTEASGECGIAVTWQVMKSVVLAPN